MNPFIFVKRVAFKLPTELHEKYKQYGFLNFLKRLILGGLSRIGISINKWLVCTQQIDANNLQSVDINSKFKVKEMTFQDFESSKKFDVNKLKSFKEKLQNKFFAAFGVYDKDNLAYYCWISLNEFQFSKNLYHMKLDESQGLLFDAFCFSDYRGNRLHNFMNIYRLKKLAVYKKKEAVVILLSQNVPARKSQKRAGFKCLKQILTYSFFGKKGHFINNKKIDL